MGFSFGCVCGTGVIIVGNGKIGVAGVDGVTGVEVATMLGVPGNVSTALLGVCGVSGTATAAKVETGGCSNVVGVVTIPG